MAKKKVSPRKVPTREEKYMGLAFWIASFSKDPSTQCGAIIVSKDNEPLGTGYNGPPSEYSDHDVDFGRPDKYDDMVHAEMNAIKYSDQTKLAGSKMYVTTKPCKICMLQIVNNNIKTVIYFAGQYYDSGSMMASKEMHDATDEIARKGSCTLLKFNGNLNWMRDRVEQMVIMGIFD